VFLHRNVDVDGLSIRLAELREAQRDDARPGLLFLHGWPQDWSSFQSTMLRLTRECRVAAIDLPGIGGSTPAPPEGDKRTLARYVHGVLAELGWKKAELLRQRYVEAYRRPGALRSSFDWYRGLRQDQRDNAAAKQLQVHTPVLYLRGGAERGIELERYLAGLREHGLCELVGDVIPGSGHFTPDEQPEALARRIAAFLRSQCH
jgi:pimeloyl-ACP methyl ester carboxylesterase